MCRRTFEVYSEPRFSEHSSNSRLTQLDASALRLYIFATASLQNNIQELSDSLPRDLHEPIVRDVRLMTKLGPILSEALLSYPTVVTDALCDLGIISTSQGCQNDYRVLPSPWIGWVEMTLTPPEEFMSRRVLHFHLLEGHILINGKAQGKLSGQFSSSRVLEEIFGKVNLRAFSSNLPGMEYCLTIRPYDNEIHVGLRNGVVFVRVYHVATRKLWEILDPRIFCSSQSDAMGKLSQPSYQS